MIRNITAFGIFVLIAWLILKDPMETSTIDYPVGSEITWAGETVKVVEVSTYLCSSRSCQTRYKLMFKNGATAVVRGDEING